MLIIGRGICDGMTVTDLAAAVDSDRGSFATWLRRADFLDEIAGAFWCPAAFGVQALSRLRYEGQRNDERVSACRLRLNFWDAVRDTHRRWFDRDETEQEIIEADFYNYESHFETLLRNLRDGTADELARGLDTAKKRDSFRRRHGVSWDCAGFGPLYSPRWSAVKWRNFEGAVSWANDMTEDEADTALANCAGGGDRDDSFDKYLDNPAKAPRDPRLPRSRGEAAALWTAVMAGADFAAAVRRIKRSNF